MKRLLAIFLCLLLISGCSQSDDHTMDERYFDMLALLESEQNYQTPINYAVSVELSATDDGNYRYYVIIDETKIAMYEIQAMAIVEGDDYSQTMAANVGIFEGVSYAMIPNQTNVDAGYVGGLSISGLTDHAPCRVLVMVRYRLEGDHESVIREYYSFDVDVTE